VRKIEFRYRRENNEQNKRSAKISAWKHRGGKERREGNGGERELGISGMKLPRPRAAVVIVVVAVFV